MRAAARERMMSPTEPKAGFSTPQNCPKDEQFRCARNDSSELIRASRGKEWSV